MILFLNMNFYLFRELTLIIPIFSLSLIKKLPTIAQRQEIGGGIEMAAVRFAKRRYSLN